MPEVPSAALVLVATPIGNLGDLSPRAVAELESADRIACEDTRRTGALLKEVGVAHDPFIVCNEHTERTAAAQIIDRIAAGQRIVLVSDAGMPGVSDPGQRIVEAAVEAGVRVTVVPGASAVLAALTISGLATERFVFEGFLPRKGGERSRRIDALRDEVRTTVFFESPRRVARTIEEFAASFGGQRPVALVRELTKTHEEVWRGVLSDAAAHLGSHDPLGEFVIVLGGAEPREATDEAILDALRQELDGGASKRDAVASVMSMFDAPKRRVYDLCLTL